MANIREVAEKAKVAMCTVSRVINGSEAVSERTREKVHKAMEELDYTPNELARGMFRQRAGIIAMLVPSIRHPFFSSLANYIETELFNYGYKLMLCSTKDNVARESDYMKIFKSNIVDGIILGVCNLEKEVYVQFQKPLILLDDYINDQIPVVVANHSEGGKLAAHKFIESGCKHVIHLCGEASRNVLSYKSHLALEKELTSHGIHCQAIEIKWNEFDFDNHLELARQLLSENVAIDGVMAADLPAMAFLKAAIQLGKKIPDDFCVVAYDGTYLVNTNIIDVTTVVQPLRDISKKAVEIIMMMIEGNVIEEVIYKLEVSMKEGETTK